MVYTRGRICSTDESHACHLPLKDQRDTKTQYRIRNTCDVANLPYAYTSEY